MHNLRFPDGFIWGTSTAAAQIETAFDHQWKGVQSRTGEYFDRTTDHEKRRAEDLEIICSLGGAYRMSMDWSRLQRSAYGEFHPEVVQEYREFLEALKARGMHVMLVLHHFAEPLWFTREGGFTSASSVPVFVDFCRKMLRYFGEYVDSWNTFNEPGGYAMMGYFLGIFPPWKKNIFQLLTVINHMSKAHEEVYLLLKESWPDKPVGISKHTMLYERESALGWFTEQFSNRFYLGYITDRFHRRADFVGMSYYGRVPLSPMPISEIDTPGLLQKRGVRHDDMWEYHPQGMATLIKRFHERYGLPIWITESGLCTQDDAFRIESIRDYLQVIHGCISEGVDIRAYFHWTAWDNFEWFLGPQFRFGLYHTDFQTMERSPKGSAAYFARIARENALVL
jgi:beta-glucosidase